MAPANDFWSVRTGDALAVLEKLNRGVLIIGLGAEVRFMNRAAAWMLERGTGLTLRCGRLAFQSLDVGTRFAAYLGRGVDVDGGSSLVLTIPGCGRRDALRVLVSPLASDADGALCDSAYAVFLYEAAAGCRPLPTKVLTRLYDLTAAEARLANGLFVGKSLQTAAARSGIKMNTARTVLKHIFAKCGVASQAELLQLLALGPRTL